MKGNHLKWFGFMLILAVLNMSCAGTSITPTYVDDTYTGKVSNFLVITVIGSKLHQQYFENEFVSQLKSIGVDAVSSAEVMEMPSDLILTKEMILDAISQHHNDAVIITQLIDKENTDLYRSGSPYNGFYDYYRAGYRYVNGPGYKTSSKTTLVLETNLFDVKTEKLIWSGITETLDRNPGDSEIVPDVVKALVDRLKESPLISK